MHLQEQARQADTGTEGEEMKERQIIFSTDMVKAILEGRKTQTRRVIRKPETYDNIRGCDFCCPYGQAGDRLWVRETWATEWEFNDYKPSLLPKRNPSDAVPFVPIAYTDTDWDGYRVGRTRPSIFMPRWASRITLEITEVRVERLQEITEEDAQAEGTLGIATHKPYPRQYRDSFEVLWDSIHDKGSPYKEHPYRWQLNPWVWCISFKELP